MVRAARLLLLLSTSCAVETPPHFRVVHHRANGCDPNAPENSLAGLRCIVQGCQSGDAPCGVEGDARILRVRGGSLGDDLEIVWFHDGATARTAVCPGGPLEFPGGAPIDASRLYACRLLRADGTPTAEPIPTLDQVFETLRDSKVILSLELKPTGDESLDDRLVVASVAKLRTMRTHTRFASFSLSQLTLAKRLAPEVPTACYVPLGAGTGQLVSYLAGRSEVDADECLNAGMNGVFVTPAALDGSMIAHLHSAGAQIGVFGIDTQDAFDIVGSWSESLDVVETDYPTLFGFAR
jgi:glycerophosphoryl diester phosphodiesterase